MTEVSTEVLPVTRDILANASPIHATMIADTGDGRTTYVCDGVVGPKAEGGSKAEGGPKDKDNQCRVAVLSVSQASHNRVFATCNFLATHLDPDGSRKCEKTPNGAGAKCDQIKSTDMVYPDELHREELAALMARIEKK